MLREDWTGALAAVSDPTGSRGGAINWFPYPLLSALSHQAAGDPGAAEEAFSVAVDTLEARVVESPEDSRYREALGLAYAGLGRASDAVREGQRALEILPLEGDALRGPFRVFAMAAIYAQLGDVPNALTHLDRAMSVPSDYSSELVERDPFMLPIRQDPRFKELMESHRGEVF